MRLGDLNEQLQRLLRGRLVAGLQRAPDHAQLCGHCALEAVALARVLQLLLRDAAALRDSTRSHIRPPLDCRATRQESSLVHHSHTLHLHLGCTQKLFPRDLLLGPTLPGARGAGSAMRAMHAWRVHEKGLA